MAISNKDRMSRSHLLRDGLVPFVERELKAKLGSSWLKAVNDSLRENLRQRADGSVAWDTQGLFTVVEKWWGDVFRFPLGRMERSYINELRETRNDFAHEKTFTYEDTERALDTASACCARSRRASTPTRSRNSGSTSKRTIYDEQRRQQVRRQARDARGHAQGRAPALARSDHAARRCRDRALQRGGFAADLAQVDHGNAGAEYGDPVEFYRRTFLTDGLRKLLAGAMRRLSRQGGDPVVDLQTNFGGGKTHSMLALYHMAGTPSRCAEWSRPADGGAGIAALPEIERAVPVGRRSRRASPPTTMMASRRGRSGAARLAARKLAGDLDDMQDHLDKQVKRMDAVVDRIEAGYAARRRRRTASFNHCPALSRRLRRRASRTATPAPPSPATNTAAPTATYVARRVLRCPPFRPAGVRRSRRLGPGEALLRTRGLDRVVVLRQRADRVDDAPADGRSWPGDRAFRGLLDLGDDLALPSTRGAWP